MAKNNLTRLIREGYDPEEVDEIVEQEALKQKRKDKQQKPVRPKREKE